MTFKFTFRVDPVGMTVPYATTDSLMATTSRDEVWRPLYSESVDGCNAWRVSCVSRAGDLPAVRLSKHQPQDRAMGVTVLVRADKVIE